MNKKVALMLSIVIAFVSIIFVSTFGLMPENLLQDVKMQELFFDREVDSVTGEKTIVKNFKANDNTIDIYAMVVYAPLDATNIVIQYTTDQPKEKVAISSTGILTIYDLTLNSFNVYIRSTDGSNLEDTLTIKKPDSNESHFGDDWEWG